MVNSGNTIKLMAFVYACLSWVLSNPAHAVSIVVNDETGKPYRNAIVSAPASNLTDPASVPAHPAIMDQQNKQFEPEILLIQTGRTVVFPNSDNIRHHVYSFSEPKPFEIRLYAGDTVPPVVFDKPGIVILGCNIHDTMVGYIYVQGDDRVWMTDDQGRVEIDDAATELTAWHPDFSVSHLDRVAFTVDPSQPVSLTIDRVSPLDTKQDVFGGSKFSRQ